MYNNINNIKTYNIIPLCRSITCYNIVNLTPSCVVADNIISALSTIHVSLACCITCKVTIVCAYWQLTAAMGAAGIFVGGGEGRAPNRPLSRHKRPPQIFFLNCATTVFRGLGGMLHLENF